MANSDLIPPGLKGLLSEVTLFNILSEPFPAEDTADIGSLSMNALSPVKDLVTQFYGGIFDSYHFQVKPGFSGIRFWYCYNTDNPNLPTFFLALEQVPSYNEKNPEQTYSSANTLLIVPEVFKYEGTDTSKTSILDFINKKDAGKTPTSNRVIPYSTVQKYALAFKQHASKMIPYNPCKYVVAYFENNSYFNDFMWRQPSKIGYFLGLTTADGHKPNYLRPVLAGFAADGSIIASKKLAGGEPFLQKSWPPPPDN
ncbi:MAG: hypothetical protein ACOYW3_02290 [Bacteroidota bacterium]